jgi:hypothetical protein
MVPLEEDAMGAKADQDPIETELIQLNHSIAELEQRRDPGAIARLDALIAPELIFRRADGTVVGKAEFMAGLQGPSPFASRTSEAVTAVVVGSRALVTLIVVTTRPDGSSARYRNVRVWDRRADGWSLGVWFNESSPNSQASNEDARST